MLSATTTLFRKIVQGQARRAMAMTVLGGFWAQAVILVSGVLVARILGIENRGHLALLAVVAVIVSQLGSLGLPLAATYWISKKPGSARSIVCSLAWPSALQAVALLGIGALALHLIVGDEERAVRLAALYTLAVIPASLGLQYALALLQGLRRFQAFNALRVLPATLYGTGILALFLAGGGDLPTVALVWSSVFVLGAMVSLVYALGGLPATEEQPPELPTRADMLRFGVKGMLGSVSPIDTFQLDQAVVGLFISPAALGLYVVAVAFTNLPRMVAQNIGFVAFPHVASLADRRAANKATWRCCLLAVAVCGGIVAALEATADGLVPLFFGSEFSASAGLMRILLASALLAGVRRVLADCARGCGYPGLGTIAELWTWVSLLAALPILVPLLGVEGVALALVASSTSGLIVLVVAVALVGRRVPAPASPHAPQPLVNEGSVGLQGALPTVWSENR